MAKALIAVLICIALAAATFGTSLSFTGLIVMPPVLGLMLVWWLTDSPLALGRARADTWFDSPDDELVVKGAVRAGDPHTR